MKEIKFVDLHAQYTELREEIDAAIFHCVNSSQFVRGSAVDKFEANFSAVIGSEYAISCGNGTDALFIALKALKVNPGDEVIVPAHSWISTSEVVSLAGAIPVFCDTNASDHNIAEGLIKPLITSKTVGILPVHLFGQACAIEDVLALAKQFDLWVIEDCAQAHLSKSHGRNVGTFGQFGAFSFYPGKNLGAMGDGGCLVTDDPDLADYATRFARHGSLYKGEHLIEGMNSRLDNLQAAILDIKLKQLAEWNQRRQVIAAEYTSQLAKISGITTPSCLSHREHSWHLYVIEVDEDLRDELVRYLQKHDIPTVINYPICLPLLPAYSRLKHTATQFPNASRAQGRILSLPMHPHMEHDQISYIIDTITRFFDG